MRKQIKKIISISFLVLWCLLGILAVVYVFFISPNVDIKALEVISIITFIVFTAYGYYTFAFKLVGLIKNGKKKIKK